MPAKTEKPTDREVREKLASRGAGALTDAELLSILVREGTAGRSAYEISEQLLEKNEGSLATLSGMELSRLRMAEGIGMNRAAMLAAAFELGIRLERHKASAPAVIVTKEDAVALMAPVMSRLRHEEMWALYLSSANGVIEKGRVSQGGVTSLIVDNKLIVKRAIELLASSVILVHNHPSGVAEPSVEDISLTRRIAEAAALFDIMLIDHIIIAGSNSYSFRQHGVIK